MNFAAPQKISVKTIDAGTDGKLSVIESSKDLPFNVRRVYYIYDVQSAVKRGFHAHKKLYQCFVVTHGTVTLNLEGLAGNFRFDLSAASDAILIPPGYWREMSNFTKDTVIMVLASEDYTEADYIHDYDTFKQWIADIKSEQIVPYLNFQRYYSLLGKELEQKAADVIRSNYFIGGSQKTAFEQEFANFCGTKHCIGVGNGLEALVLILEALGIKPGDEVIVCAAGFVATPLAVSRLKGKPVFVDCEPDGNIDPAQIENAITSATKAILITHLYGIPAEMDAIIAIGQRYNIPVLEDACQAHGALYRGRCCGSIGTAAAFSFYPTKNLGAYGDGGCVTTNDTALAEKIRKLSNYGASVKYHHEMLGTNSRLDEMQAALLRVKLPYLQQWNARRRELAKIYERELSGIEGIVLPTAKDYTVPVWHVYAIRVKNEKRDALAAHLKEQGIGTNIHYPIALNEQDCYTKTYGTLTFAEAKKQAAEVLSLPLDALHTDAEIMAVVASIKLFPSTH